MNDISVTRKTVPMAQLYPVMAEVLETGGEFTLTVTGNSMYPFWKHMRDQAVFAPLGARNIRRGDIVFYRRDNGQFVMHRVYKVSSNSSYTMLGDAQTQLEPGIRREQLLAYVVKVVRKGKTVSCERGLWRAITTAWMGRIRHPRLYRFAYKAVSLIYGTFVTRKAHS